MQNNPKKNPKNRVTLKFKSHQLEIVYKAKEKTLYMN